MLFQWLPNCFFPIQWLIGKWVYLQFQLLYRSVCIFRSKIIKQICFAKVVQILKTNVQTVNKLSAEGKMKQKSKNNFNITKDQWRSARHKEHTKSMTFIRKRRTKRKNKKKKKQRALNSYYVLQFQNNCWWINWNKTMYSRLEFETVSYPKFKWILNWIHMFAMCGQVCLYEIWWLHSEIKNINKNKAFLFYSLHVIHLEERRQITKHLTESVCWNWKQQKKKLQRQKNK